MTGPLVAGQPAAERLMAAVHHRSPAGVNLDQRDVAAVLSALADHTALEAARVHDRAEWHTGFPDQGVLVEAPQPSTTSTARWLHDVAADLTHRHATRGDTL